jgi:hypothetical protein
MKNSMEEIGIMNGPGCGLAGDGLGLIAYDAGEMRAAALLQQARVVK